MKKNDPTKTPEFIKERNAIMYERRWREWLQSDHDRKSQIARELCKNTKEN